MPKPDSDLAQSLKSSQDSVSKKQFYIMIFEAFTIEQTILELNRYFLMLKYWLDLYSKENGYDGADTFALDQQAELSTRDNSAVIAEINALLKAIEALDAALRAAYANHLQLMDALLTLSEQPQKNYQQFLTDVRSDTIDGLDKFAKRLAITPPVDLTPDELKAIDLAKKAKLSVPTILADTATKLRNIGSLPVSQAMMSVPTKINSLDAAPVLNKTDISTFDEQMQSALTAGTQAHDTDVSQFSDILSRLEQCHTRESESNVINGELDGLFTRMENNEHALAHQALHSTVLEQLDARRNFVLPLSTHQQEHARVLASALMQPYWLSMQPTRAARRDSLKELLEKVAQNRSMRDDLLDSMVNSQRQLSDLQAQRQNLFERICRLQNFGNTPRLTPALGSFVRDDLNANNAYPGLYRTPTLVPPGTLK